MHADAAIQHAQVQLMSSARAQAERMKEDNRGRGEGQRSGVKERGEDWWSGTVKNKENSEGSKTHEGTEAVPLPTSFPPFRSRLLSRTASHALHTHPHVRPPPRSPKHLVLTKHCCLLLYMKTCDVCLTNRISTLV